MGLSAGGARQVPSAYHRPGQLHQGLFCEGDHPEGLRRGLSLLLGLWKNLSLVSSEHLAVALSTASAFNNNDDNDNGHDHDDDI